MSLPRPLRVLWSNLIDVSGTTLSASSAPLSVYNLRSQNRKRVWRGSTRTETITANLNTPTDNIRCVAITGHNLSTTASIKIEYSDNGSSWTQLQTKTVGDLTVVSFFFDLLNNQYWRLTFTDTANTDGYVSAGRMFLGDYWEPDTAAVSSWDIKIADASQVRKSIGGQKWTNQREVFARLTFRLLGLNEVDGIRNFLNIARRIGIKNDIFLILTPGGVSQFERELSLYGRFVGIPGLTGNSSFAYDTGSVVFEESF